MDHEEEQGYSVGHFTSARRQSYRLRILHRKHPGAGSSLVATNQETLNISLSQTADGASGHFITHSSQSLLTVNGIRIPTGTIAGPLPLFAVIEIGDLAAFWWGDLGGMNYLPRGPTTQAKVTISCKVVEDGIFRTNMANRALESAHAWNPMMSLTTSTTMTFHWQREQSCLQVSSTFHCSVSLP